MVPGGRCLRNIGYAVAVAVLTVALPVAVWLDMRQLSETNLEQQAQNLSRVVGLVRNFYDREVVRRIKENEGAATFSHVYRDIPGGVPVPATFSIELANGIRENVVNLDYRFVSDLPFNHRGPHELTAFETASLQAFRSGQRTEEIEFSGDMLSRQIALAVPVIMQQGCVDCHNAHPNSPKTDWNVGDVRGLQTFSVARPITVSFASFQHLSIYLIVLIGAGGFFIYMQGRQGRALMASNHALGELNAEIGTARQRLVDAVESTSEGFALYDEQDRLILCNTRYRELFSPDRESDLPPGARFEAIVRSAVESGLISPEGQTVDEWVDARLARHRNPGAPFIQRRPDGRWVQASERKTTDGGTVSVHTDITVLKRAEDDLRAAKESAEQALHELEAANASLIQAEKMASLGGLVAGVAHEINTPVGVTLTAATHLDDNVRKIQTAFAAGQLKRSDFEDYITLSAETMQIIVSNLHRAAELIQSFKQVAVDQTSEEWREFDLGAYIRELLRSLGPSLKESTHPTVVDCPEGLQLASYPGALAQILTNLLINSMTHAYEPGSTGELRIAVTESEPGVIHLVYSDDGKGIPEEDLGKIFDPFFTTRRGSGGSGLGLNLVYNLATQTLGGSIAVESRVGEGVQFTIDFPKELPAPPK